MADLEGLLGPEIAFAFTKWLFEEVDRLKGTRGCPLAFVVEPL